MEAGTPASDDSQLQYAQPASADIDSVHNDPECLLILDRWFDFPGNRYCFRRRISSVSTRLVFGVYSTHNVLKLCAVVNVVRRAKMPLANTSTSRMFAAVYR